METKQFDNAITLYGSSREVPGENRDSHPHRMGAESTEHLPFGKRNIAI